MMDGIDWRQHYAMVLVVFAVLAHPFDLASGEIRDVLKSSEIDAIFARTQESSVVHKGPRYTLTFKVQQKNPDPTRCTRTPTRSGLCAAARLCF